MIESVTLLFWGVSDALLIATLQADTKLAAIPVKVLYNENTSSNSEHLSEFISFQCLPS